MFSGSLLHVFRSRFCPCADRPSEAERSFDPEAAAAGNRVSWGREGGGLGAEPGPRVQQQQGGLPPSPPGWSGSGLRQQQRRGSSVGGPDSGCNQAS